MFKRTPVLLLLSVVIAPPATGQDEQRQGLKRVIFQEDFERGFEQRAAKWQGSAETELTENPGMVISGEHSLKVAGGKIAVLDPRLHVDPSMLVQLSFDFRVAEPMEPGLRPHGESRLVGVSNIMPYLHHNFVRQDNRRGLGRGEGRSSTRVWHVPYEDDLRLIFRVIGPASVLIDNIKLEAWPTAGSEAKAAPEEAPAVLPLAIDIDSSVAGLDCDGRPKANTGPASTKFNSRATGPLEIPLRK